MGAIVVSELEVNRLGARLREPRCHQFSRLKSWR
jgi:hypothetical protein